MIIFIGGFEYRMQQSNCKLTSVEKKINAQLDATNILYNRENMVIGVNTSSRKLKDYIVNSYDISKKIYSAFKYCSKDDVIYIRHMSIVLPILFGLLMYGKSKRKCKVVLEMNAIERRGLYGRIFINHSGDIFKMLYYIYSYIVVLLFEKTMLMSSDGVISVTSEISEYYRAITNNKLHYLINGNGIDIRKITTKNKPISLNKELHILVVAIIAKWHGIDRFIRGMHEYSGDNTIILHIVGDGPELQNLKSLTSELHLESHVIFHGYKSGADLDAMFAQCHIAIGGLADFRRGLKEVSLLKNREYCARGIPFVLAAKDIDFPDEWAYTLHVPATEDPINMEQIITFAKRVMSNQNHSQEMRKYAEQHLDWYPKMKILKDFLEKL